MSACRCSSIAQALFIVLFPLRTTGRTKTSANHGQREEQDHGEDQNVSKERAKVNGRSTVRTKSEAKLCANWRNNILHKIITNMSDKFH